MSDGVLRQPMSDLTDLADWLRSTAILSAPPNSDARKKLETAADMIERLSGKAEPVAWLCELYEDDGSVKRMLVDENPEGFRWGDIGEPSPFKVTPLFAHPAAPAPDDARDAELGRIAMRFVDRAGDVAECDPAEKICAEFYAAMSEAIDAAMKEKA